MEPSGSFDLLRDSSSWHHPSVLRLLSRVLWNGPFQLAAFAWKLFFPEGFAISSFGLFGGLTYSLWLL